ncbi:hypothetical protein RN001_000166 [Aquatica leii]|uniref:Uncharacterized protein n=1 Tax=Aquatica leii TaxID=1421715 RepID=A0AAN7Q9F6_9COLE|nr:hypothetical protein RN001_000166 [Aquatica leii]
MANEIEIKKKSRKALRTSFTKTANELEALFSVDKLDRESIEVTDVEGRDTYFKRFTGLKVKYNRLSEDSATEGTGSHRTGTYRSNVRETTGRRKFKLPRIEFKHYDDDTIDNHDKIEYLVQATVPGSRARQLVESYLAMSENYKKIVESMQSRFGREVFRSKYM